MCDENVFEYAVIVFLFFFKRFIQASQYMFFMPSSININIVMLLL